MWNCERRGRVGKGGGIYISEKSWHYKPTCDDPFNPGVHVLVQPDHDDRPVLQVSEDKIDGLNHHLLNLLLATVAHLVCKIININKLSLNKNNTNHLEINLENKIRPE